jgi:hypothetical protein
MKPRVLLVSLLPFAVMPLVLVHCSGGSSTAVGGEKDAGSNTSSGGGGGSGSGSGSGGESSSSGGGGGDDGGPVSGDAGTSSGSPGDSGAEGDAAATTSVIPVPDGGAPSDPLAVECGGASCSVVSNACCFNQGDGGGTCASSNTACGTGQVKLGCNESSDCAGGVCCETIVGLGIQGPTQCESACPAGTFQLCRTNGDCGVDGGAPGKCIVQSCTDPSTSVAHIAEACSQPPTLMNPLGGALYGCVAK